MASYAIVNNESEIKLSFTARDFITAADIANKWCKSDDFKFSTAINCFTEQNADYTLQYIGINND